MGIELASSFNLFLPYQKRWLLDTARFKLSEKSRRTGFTWVQAFEDVKDANTLLVRGKPVDTWFSSANASAAVEYILYCEGWAKAVNASFEPLGEIIIDEDKDIKALSMQFKNGARINALTSNPKGFRSKGGKVVLDEFAFHENPVELWKAAKPVITWGYLLRIISSLNGTNNLFYKFIEKIRKGQLKWSLHKVDIFQAVAEGLADKILDRKLTEEERQAWIEEERQGCGDEVTWQQEYCCVAVDEGSAFLPYELINTCIEDTLFEDLSSITNDFYVGYDVARKRDLSIISIFEKLGSVFYLRKIYELKNVKYSDQKSLISYILANPKCRRLAIDNTGIGNQMAEELKDEFGSRLVEPVTFTSKAKEEMAYKLLYAFQDKNIRIPDDELIKNDLHSVKRIATEVSNVIRFDVSRSETDGHADRFWSFALAVYAGTNAPYQKPIILSAKPNIYKGLNGELNLNGLDGLLRGFN